MGLAIRLEAYLPPGESMDEVVHLIDHGEPAIALGYMAQQIVAAQVKVPRDLIRTLREELSYFPEEPLPTNLDDFAD